jgi:hypothetical protein
MHPRQQSSFSLQAVDEASNTLQSAIGTQSAHFAGSSKITKKVPITKIYVGEKGCSYKEFKLVMVTF